MLPPNDPIENLGGTSCQPAQPVKWNGIQSIGMSAAGSNVTGSVAPGPLRALPALSPSFSSNSSNPGPPVSGGATASGTASPDSGVSGELAPIQRIMERINYERHTSSRRRVDFKLDTVRQMLARLGNPHRQLRIVHIAGTKGKGSTSHFVARLGSALGLKTAIYSSPHFERYTERFQIDHQEVSEAVLNPCLARVLAVAEELDREIEEGTTDQQPATFFDISTVAAFLLFAEQQVELVALEVGLGGRLDSTNVCQAQVAVITSISLDHMRQLGPTTVAIAGEKAGIIKSAAPAICGPVDEDVLAVIQDRAQQHAAPLDCFGRDFGARPGSVLQQGAALRFDYWNADESLGIDGLELQVLGQHQIANACLALTALLKLLPDLNLPPEVDWRPAFRAGLAQTKLTGRLEVVSADPLIITDMAHNQASIAAMVAGLRSLGTAGPKQVIFSCSRDKDHWPMLRSIIGYFDRIILTRFQDNPRGFPLDLLQRDLQRMLSEAESARQPRPAIIDAVDLPIKAFELAMEQAAEYQQTVICGSIFLVGELMPVLRDLQRENRR